MEDGGGRGERGLPTRPRPSRAPLVDRLADDVHNAAKALLADGDRDRLLGVDDSLAAHKALGGVHRNRADGGLTQVLRHLEHQPHLVPLDLEGVEDGGQVAVKLHVDDGTNDLRDLAGLGRHGGGRGIAGCDEWAPRAVRYSAVQSAIAGVQGCARREPPEEGGPLPGNGRGE